MFFKLNKKQSFRKKWKYHKNHKISKQNAQSDLHQKIYKYIYKFKKNWDYEKSLINSSFSIQKSFLYLWQVKVRNIIDETKFKKKEKFKNK